MITYVTDAVSITVSGSTGMARIFRKARVVFELERRPGPRFGFRFSRKRAAICRA